MTVIDTHISLDSQHNILLEDNSPFVVDGWKNCINNALVNYKTVTSMGHEAKIWMVELDDRQQHAYLQVGGQVFNRGVTCKVSTPYYRDLTKEQLIDLEKQGRAEDATDKILQASSVKADYSFHGHQYHVD